MKAKAKKILSLSIVLSNLCLFYGCITLPERLNHSHGSIIGIQLEQKNTNKFFYYVYFLKLNTNKNILEPENIIQSDFSYFDYHYLFNVAKGYYALAFACAEEPIPMDIMRIFLLKKELITNSIIEVKEDSIYFMGKFIIDIPFLTPFKKETLKNIDHVQKYYYNEIKSNSIKDFKPEDNSFLIFYYDVLFIEKINNSKYIEVKFLINSMQLFENTNQYKIFYNRYNELTKIK